MKIIVIGDTHGREDWKKIIQDNPEFDMIVFLGDYFDSRDDISATAQIHNFENIVAFKRANHYKCTLLIGNHDFHYLRGISERYSGFQELHHWDIQIALEENMSHLQMCYKWEDYIFTHAGISKTWLKSTGYEEGDVEDFVNTLFINKRRLFTFSGNDPYGDDVTQSPIWIRTKSLSKDAIEGIHVIGHTSVSVIKIDKNRIMVDAIGSKQYLIIEDTPKIINY